MKSLIVTEGKNDVEFWKGFLREREIDTEEFKIEEVKQTRKGNQQSEFVRSLKDNPKFSNVGVKSEGNKDSAEKYFSTEIAQLCSEFNHPILMVDMDSDGSNSGEELKKRVKKIQKRVQDLHSDHKIEFKSEVFETEHLISAEFDLFREKIDRHTGSFQIICWKSSLENANEELESEFSDLHYKVGIDSHINF